MGRLDINDFIVKNGGDPKKIIESQRRRGVAEPEKDVNEVISMWEDHQKTQYQATQVKAEINKLQKDHMGKVMKEMGSTKKELEKAKKANGSVEEIETKVKELDLQKEKLLGDKNALDEKAKMLENEAAQKEVILNRKVNTIGNYVHDSVPVSNNEDDNAVQKTWAPEGVKVEKKGDWHLSHHEVLTRLDGYDPERGAKIAGHRAYFLKNNGAFLNEALRQYGMHFLSRKGFDVLDTPQFMNQGPMAKTAQLEQFDEELYKVDDGGEPKYLIATSEQPISAMYANEWMTAKDLPKKLAGTSTCYRKEAGKHGKDAWGLFRTHQFNKIEQFLITDPEKSWEAFEDMIANSEEFYQSLGIPYQVVAVVSGALNDTASKKYDLEGWFPFQGEYKELVSCSNCTDYQSRDLEVRFGQKLKVETRKKYVHMLNCTLTATGRTLCAVLENFQTEEGLTVPEPLRRYMPDGEAFIPYVKELSKDSTSQRAKELV